ncbi:MAG: RND family transporter [Spirochaetes bacterium]|nr:RND family transporter [Spirochaetota bacterium]
MIEKFARFVVRFRVLIIAVVIVLTLALAFFATQVRMSSNLIDLAPEDNPELITLQETLGRFGSTTFVMVSVKSDNAYSFSTLTKIKNISDEIRTLHEVEDIIDPLSAKVFKYLFGMVVVKTSFPGGEIPESREKIAKIKEEMLAEPILKNVVVSENGESLAIYIKIKNGVDTQHLRDKLTRIIEPYQGPEVFYLAGRPIIESWVKEYIRRDLVRLAIPIILLVIVVLFINFRSGRGVILPLSIMIGSMLWTLGLMGLFGKTISMVGVMLPTLVLVISSSYSIHFLNQYYKDVHADLPRRRCVEGPVVHIGKTIILAALTTIAGFAALTINRIKPMRDLGVFVLIGVFISMMLSLTFLPSILSMLKNPRRTLRASTEGSRMNRFFLNLGDMILKRWKIILIIALVIAIWAIVGIPNIKVNTSWKRFFKKNSDLLTSQRFIRSNFGGVSTINVSFITEEDDMDFKTLATIRYIDRVERWIRDQNLLGLSNSLVGYIKRANQLIHENNPDEYRLPENDADLLKIFLMFKMSKFTESLSNVITDDYRHANIVVRTVGPEQEEVTIAELKEFLRNFRAFVRDNPHEGIEVRIAGVDLIYVSLIDYLIRSQLISILLSIIIVFIIIAITFRSLAFGFFGLIPIFFGLFLNFGTMSYFNVSLDFITSMIASIAVGLGVDNSIHYLIRFTRTEHSLPLKERLKQALGVTGTPIFFTSFTLIAGFSVLLFSSFKPILYFGLLISVTMLGCFIGVIFILPAFIYLVKPKAIIQGKAE